MLNTLNLRGKLFVLIFTVIIIPITIAVGVLYRRSVQGITGQISNVVINSLNFTIDYIELSLNSVIGMSELILNEESVIAAARTTLPMGEREIINTNITIRRAINIYIQRIRSTNSSFGFDSYYLYLPNQNLLMDSKTTYYENINIQNIDFLRLNDHRGRWFITRAIDYYTLNDIENRFGWYGQQLTFVNEITDDEGRVIASLAANVRGQFLNDFYNGVEKGIPGNFMIIDDEGSYITNNDSRLTNPNPEIYEQIKTMIENEKKASGIFQISTNGQVEFIVYSISEQTGWKYVVLIPAIGIFGQIYNMQKYFIYVIIIITLLIIPICFLITGNLYKPLEKLVRAMQNIENGDLEVRISDQRKDEYQKVYTGFNSMAGKLKSLVDDLSNEKSLKTQAEINLLQAQINPHFLYNTLDSIYSIATVYQVEEISRIVAALSKFFRVSLSGGKSDISLKNALEIVKSYLIIQNIRFDNKIDYKISIPEDCLEMVVPKLLLQPIVENSVYHGMEQKKGKGHLSINCSSKENVLYICINDDGIGITAERLAVLKKSIHSDTVEDSNNFALKNLNKQVVLKYGQEYGLGIESAYGIGTVVTVSMPVVYADDGV